MKSYILVDKVPVEEPDIMKWGAFMNGPRHVAETMIGEAKVSTVFLGLDHNWSGGPPILFETMIFGGKLEGYETRCSTWEEAEKQHRLACATVLTQKDD